MITTKENPLVFEANLDFKKIRTVFSNIRRLYSSFDYSATFQDNLVQVLLVSDLFKARLMKISRQVSFNLEESEIAQVMLNARRFDGAVVIFQEDCPESSLWKNMQDFMCIDFVNSNGGLLPSDDKYISYPSIKGYASVGYGYYFLTIYDCEDEFIQTLMKEPENWYVQHDCDEAVCRYTGFGLGDFVNYTTGRNLISIPIEIGKVFVCKKCGETLLMDCMKPEWVLNMYRKYVKTKGETS